MRHISKVLPLTCLLAIALVFTTGSAQADPDQAWLGVFTQTVDKNMAQAFDLGTDHGAIVNSIIDKSPAALGGLEEDDIIIAFNGKPVKDEDDLVKMIDKSKPGDEAKITVMRGSSQKDLTVKLADRDDNKSSYSFGSMSKSQHFAPYWSNSKRSKSYGYLGVYLADVSPEAMEALGASKGGVLINDVEEDSPAEKAGLKPGDIIVAVNDKPVEDADDLTDIIRDMKEGDKADIKVIRNGREDSVEASVTEHEDNIWFAGPGAVKVPDLSGLKLNLDDLRFDSNEAREDLREAVEELKEQMKEFRDQLKEMRDELRDRDK